MFSTVISDLALLCWGVAAVVAAAGFAWLAFHGVKKIMFKLRDIEVHAEGANRAVNCVPEGTLPLAARVRLIEDDTTWLKTSMEAVLDHLGIEAPSAA